MFWTVVAFDGIYLPRLVLLPHQSLLLAPTTRSVAIAATRRYQASSIGFQRKQKCFHKEGFDTARVQVPCDTSSEAGNLVVPVVDDFFDVAPYEVHLLDDR